MKVTVIVPARYGSTRFPGKPLANILNKPMIQHVYENVSASALIDEVIVATDEEKIKNVVEGFDGRCFLTSKEHATGTDRIAEVAKNLSTDIIVNVQGDEPLISTDHIEKLVEPLLNNETIQMATLKTKITNLDDITNPNVVKVITNKQNHAIYFSRSAIPYNRENIEVEYYKHIGVYAYRRSFLFDYINLPQSMLEEAESLEQLRAIENNQLIYVSEVFHELIGVDVPEDISKVEEYLKGAVR